MKNLAVDYLIIGGGIVGITIAIQLKKALPEASVILLDKEKQYGFHASGRNSGVLHAGLYYEKNSLKAKFCRDGNLELTRLCQDRGLPINPCGKLVVCKNEDEKARLETLYKRGINNNINIQMVDSYEARQIDPVAKTFQSAIWSPTTSTIDPLAVLKELYQEAAGLGVELRMGEKYLQREAKNLVVSSKGRYQCKYLINAAGLFADKVARDWGFSRDYRILPFKGLYLYLLADAHAQALPKVHVYPVPDLEFPFLGVHFTITVDGAVKIGPTAIPALWREQYDGMSRFNVYELLDITSREFGLFIKNKANFRSLAKKELAHLNKKNILRAASQLVTGNLNWAGARWGKPGIRAQLFDIRKSELKMDFLIEHDGDSCHILNAVSPAFTCSFPFAQYVVNKIKIYN